MSVVGARPQFVKLAPIARALRGRADHVIVHTGQHYDPSMSDVFFEEFAIPAPHVNLGVGSGSHGMQTAAMLSGLESVLIEERPDWVLVYGDTNSTLAAALAAVKLHLPLAHLEAGLRSFNRSMPEEHNRVLTDHAADVLLAPTDRAAELLAAEGLAARTVVVGDVMADVCLQVRDAVRTMPAPEGLPADFFFATLHRAENTDDPGRLGAILDALGELPAPIVLAAHPRLVDRAAAAGLPLERDGFTVVPPLSYRVTIRTLLAARGVVTDSGGLQKEAYLLGRPCTTVRAETEWRETLTNGWNVLAPDPSALAGTVSRAAPTTDGALPFGSGQAAHRVADVLVADA